MTAAAHLSQDKVAELALKAFDEGSHGSNGVLLPDLTSDSAGIDKALKGGMKGTREATVPFSSLGCCMEAAYNMASSLGAAKRGCDVDRYATAVGTNPDRMRVWAALRQLPTSKAAWQSVIDAVKRSASPGTFTTQLNEGIACWHGFVKDCASLTFTTLEFQFCLDCETTALFLPTLRSFIPQPDDDTAASFIGTDWDSIGAMGKAFFSPIDIGSCSAEGCSGRLYTQSVVKDRLPLFAAIESTTAHEFIKSDMIDKAINFPYVNARLGKVETSTYQAFKCMTFQDKMVKHKIPHHRALLRTTWEGKETLAVKDSMAPKPLVGIDRARIDRDGVVACLWVVGPAKQ